MDGVDRVCRAYTQCKARVEYLQRKGNETNDNVCAAKTECFDLLPERYESYPPTNSMDISSNGTDAVCSEYSECGPGQRTTFSGNRTHDVQCAACPAGKYSADGALCHACTVGTFAPHEGMSACLQCNDCTTVQNQGCPIGESCTPGFASLCELDRDSVCMMCPDQSWSMNPTSRVCSRCARGYHDDPGTGCRPCTENFFCPSKDLFLPCQDIRVFQRQAGDPAHSIVPSSAAGKIFSSDCQCNRDGGFEGSADGLIGCTPCRDGWFSRAGDKSCSMCEEGKFSVRR